MHAAYLSPFQSFDHASRRTISVQTGGMIDGCFACITLNHRDHFGHRRQSDWLRGLGGTQSGGESSAKVAVVVMGCHGLGQARTKDTNQMQYIEVTHQVKDQLIALLLLR